jgi:uncharacterized membrane protein YgcG
MASSTATSTSRIEITNDAGSTVYGSTTNPTSDIFTITLNNNTLTANTTETQYRIRITPKTHANMPAVPGSTYLVSSYISNWVGTGAIQAGSDIGATTTYITIDNTSPGEASDFTGTTNSLEQIVLSFTNATSTDASSTVVLSKIGSLVTDSPVEGTSYSQGNTIGGSTVACVSNSITPSVANTCTISPTKGVYYYFKVFTKDATGNYSSGVVPTGQPFYFAKRSGGFVTETEVQNGGTTTQGGGGQGGGDTGSSTGGTTTQGGGGGGGGGGGDSGSLYYGSSLATLEAINEGFKLLFGALFSSNVRGAYAETRSSADSSKPCFISLFSSCVFQHTSLLELLLGK